MTTKPLSPNNPRVREAVKLRQKKFRRETGCILIEGARLVADALAAGAAVKELFCTSAFRGSDHGKAIALDTPENLKTGLGRDIVTLRTTPAIEEPEQLFAGLDMQAYTRLQPDKLRLEVRDAEAIVGELVTRITAAHRLESIRIARPTLDDVFLHHTGRALRD